MKLFKYTLTVGLAALMAAPTAFAGELSAADVKALFSGKTVESMHLKKDISGTTYYDPNGQFYGMRDDSIWQGKWSVQDDGNICLTFESGKTRCRFIEQEDGVYYKVKVKGNGKPLCFCLLHGVGSVIPVIKVANDTCTFRISCHLSG